MASEYDRKFEEMKNYIPFLESMIKRLESTSGSSNPRQAQLDKIRSLRDLLLDKKKRMKMENLLKCEQVLVNLYAKVEQRDTLPGIDLKTPSNPVKVKDEPDLDLVRNKLKIVTKMQEESPGTLPEIARANETRDESTAGAKEPALFQRRPNLMGSSSSCTPTKSLDTKNPQPRRNYTRVLVSPEQSPQRWSKHDDTPEKPLFSRRSPRRQSPTYHRKDRKHSKQDNSPKSKDLNNLNITLKVPEERLDSLNTSDIFSRIIHCSDSDVDITTLRELRSQILGELKHTGAKDDISDLILNSSKRKKKKKSHKRKEEIEEGELSDSESEAIENIYGSLVIVDKDQNTTESKVSNKHDQKPRKIQIRLVINSENEAGSSDSPSTSDKKGIVSDISDVSELEMFDKDLEPRASNKEVTKLQIESKEKQSKLDVTKSSEFDIAPKASQLLDEIAPNVSELAPKAPDFSDEIAPKASELSDEIAPKASELPVEEILQKAKEVFLEKKETNNSNEFISRNEGTLIETNKKQEDKNSNDMKPYKPNFYKPLTVQETDNKDKADENVNTKDTSKNCQNDAGLSSDQKVSTIKETVSSNNDRNVDMLNKVSENVEIPLLNEPSVASHKPKESVVSDIDILQALKNEILSETIAIPGTDAATPALHQPKLTKVANAQEIAPKKRISIENYKQKATPKPATKPLFTSQSSKDKDDQNKKQSLKLTEKECERFKIALANDLSSDDDDIYDDLNKSGDDDMDLAPKSPDIDDSSTVGNNIPVIIPVDPVKDIIASSKADVDMRTLMPILSPLATPSPPVKEVSSQKSVIDTKQIISKSEKNRPCDPRLKRDIAPSIMPNEPPKPVPPPLLPFPNVTATMPVGINNLISTLTPSPNMTPTMTPIINPGMTPNRMPNMTPVRAPNMTPIMTPNSRTFEIDDQPKRKHVYASLCDPIDYNDDIQRPHWEKPDNTNSHEPRWEPIDDRDRNQHSSMQATQDGQKYNRYNDSRSFYNNYNKPDGRDDPQVQLYRRTDAPMTPSHPFGRSECPPTPSHPFGRSECPPTPSHPFGRLDCPPTPNHPFGRSEGPTLSHSYSRSECPMTPSHPFGRSECPATPNHSFGRSECPMTPTHSFGRADVPVTPTHPFGRMDRDPRLQKGYDYDNNVQNDDRNRRYYNEQASYKPYNPKHDLNSKSYNDNYRNHREQSTGRSDRNRPDYYKEQGGRHYNDDRMSRHEQSGNRSRNFDGDQCNSRGQKTDNDYYPTRFREVESRPNYQQEKCVGRTNSIEDRHVRSNSRARSIGRNNEIDDENTLSVKPHVGRSFTIDTSVNSTFQDVVKGNQEKSIFDQLFDRRKRASSVGRTFVRETSVGRTQSRPSIDHSESTNGRFRRARSVVKDIESKSFSEVKADFESYRSKTNTSSNRNSNAIQTKTALDRNSPRISKGNNIPSSKISESKQPYSPRKNYRDPRLNRDPRHRHHDPRVRQKDDKYRYDARDKKNHGIIYSNDNIASGTILGSGYGVKNYKIPKIKRPEEPVSIEKTDTSKSIIVDKDKKPDGNIETKNKNKEKDLNIKNKNKDKESDFKNKRKEKDSDKNKNKEKESDANNKNKEKESDANNKNKEKESDNANNKIKAKEFKTLEKESKPTDNVKSYVDNSDKRLRKSSRINEKEESNILDVEVIAKPRRTRLQIRESESESEDNTKAVQKDVIPKVQSPKKHPKIFKDKKDSKNDSLDDSFGIDDLEIFSENTVSEPVIDNIDSLIADLDEDLNASRNEGASKFTNEISLENMLENITCQSATEVTNDISIDTALEDINKLIGNDESENGNKTEVSNAFPTLEKSPEQKIKVQSETQTKITDNVLPSVDEKKSGDVETKIEKDKDIKRNKPQSAANEQIPLKEADDIVSTTENVINEIKADDNKKENNEQIERSTTPDSTNTDAVPKESIRVDSFPDSTDEVHSEASEVSSSNTSAQLSLKDPEPSSLKEASSASNPLGNILSILQSKSKIKELLSMLGDQSSDNDKIKKKLEKLSEIVSDDEDTRDDAEQESAIGIDQESRDDTEIESKDNEDEESRDGTEQDIPKENQIETDNKALKDNSDKAEVPSLNNSEQKQDEMSSVDNSMENNALTDESENTTAAKKKNIVKKVPMKRKTYKGKFVRKPLTTEDKRVTRSVVTVKKSAPARKKKSELLKLQEDIKEMFISDDVLNVTGIRMCRLAKLVDDNGQKDVSAKSDTEPVVVLEKFNKNESLYETLIEGKATKTKLGPSIKKKPGPKSKVKVILNESSGDAEEKVEKPKAKPKNKPGPKSKTKSKIQCDVDPYDFETDSVNESNASKISEGSIRDSSEVSDSESFTSLTSFGSSEALSELKTLAELKKKPKRKRSSWKAGVIKQKRKKKADQKTVEFTSKNQTTDEKQCIAIPDFNCFTDKKYCYVKNIFSYSCRLCVYSGEEIVAHYKKEHPHTEIPLSRLSPEVAKEAIEQCEEINFQAISKIPTDKYVCRFCYKEFGKKKAALETFFWHVVSMHTGEYKQICSECVNITRCPFNLDIPPPPKDIKGQLIGYICGKCNFTQISLENLKTHVIVRHNDEQTEVYTINLAVMSRKIINLLSKRVSVPETDKSRVLRSSRSNQSMTEMSDDRSDATETNSCFTDPETLKDEIPHKGVKEIKKLSLESKSKLQSKITFENDDSTSDTNLAPVKIEKEDLDEEDREELTNAAVEPRSDNESSTVVNQRGAPVSDNSATQPHFKVNYTDTGTGIELMCFINSNDSHYKCNTLRSFRTHVHSKHKEERWDGYCYSCKDFVHDKGKYFFKDCLTHFQIKHMDSEMVSEVYFRINYSETGLRQYLCFIDGHDHYQCPSLLSLKLHVGSHKGKWNGHCFDCKEFVKPKGEYFIEECLSHYLLKHQLDGSSPDASAIAREIVASCQMNQLCTEATSSEENKQPENPVSDIFAHPHFKVSYTDTGSKEFVCCINLKDEIHYKTPLLISFKRHVQTKHSENWDGYCFVCKVIVMPQGRHLFKDCLQHFVDKHMDDFPVLEKLLELEKPEEESTSSPRPYINVRPLSQLKDIDTEEDRGLVLPKIESVVSLGTPSAPEVDFSAPSETELTEPPPADPQPDAQIEEFHNYEASQIKVMSQKHPVVQEAMLRKEKLVKVFKCAGSFCSFATDSADMALSHALTHQKIGGENALCCSYCDFDCSGNAIDLVVHVFKHASCPYSCGYCFYRAAAAQLVVAHSNTAHSGKSVKVYIANKATIPEKDTSQMLSREDVVLYYVCKNEDTLCKFKTYTARKFCDHLQTRHPCSEHSCYICSQKLATATDLIQHMKSHELNLYQCTWCIHGADSEPELLAHAAARHPTHQPQAYLRIITNKDGSSEMRVLPLASFNKSSVGVEHVVSNALPENPVKEAERSIDLQKLIGQTKLLFESMTSTDTPSEPSVAPTAARRISNADDMATISPTVSAPPSKTPPRQPTPQPDIAEQTTPVLKSEPAEITPSKVSNEIVCLDSDEEDQPTTDAPKASQRNVENVIDISEEEEKKSAEVAAAILQEDKVFKCPKCLHCCKTDTGLKLHILKCYNPNWPMACPHCHKMTDNREVLIQHYIFVHCKKYVCGVCNREMHSLKGAKIHFKLLHKVTKVHVEYGVGDKPNIVTKEKAPVPTRVAPKRKLSMTNVAAPPPKQIKRYGPQDVDQLPINPILDDLVYCALCEFNTKVRLNLVRHLQRHAESQPVPETAPVNPVPHLETNEMHFDKMVNLASSSLAKDKPKEVGPIVSQIPPEAAARYPKYIPERQRYTCGAKDCSYISVDEGMLRCHWETLHSEMVDYRCVHCPPYQHLDKSKPLTAARIMMHLKMHDTSLYACSSCTYYHFRRQFVEKHITDSHKGTGQLMVVREEATGPLVPPSAAGSAPTMDLKPWQCGLCSFKSMLRAEVVEHCSKNHQSKMQFKCSYCPFRTSTLENVVKHQTNSHPGRPEEIFYYYYREGSVTEEDGNPTWMKQRQKMGITDDPVVKTEVSEGVSSKPDPPMSVAVAASVVLDLNLVKKEVEEENGQSVEELCGKFGQFCEPNGLKYKCPLCTVVTEDSREAIQSHLYEELQYRRWRCSICSYKAFHRNGLHEHISTEHRGRMQEPLPINLPADVNIERWVAELLRHQTAIIEKNKQNLLGQKVQTAGPTGALNAPQKVPEKPVEIAPKTKYAPKELEDAFGQFGVANNKEYCCPKCVFRSEREEVMREHLESELTKIRWCCSACPNTFQNYHEAQFHCKTHEGQSSRPKEAIRDPYMRAAWVTSAIQTQKQTITENSHPIIKPLDSLLKPIETNINPGESLLVEKNMQKLIGQRVQRPAKVTTPEKEESQSEYQPKELEDAFGQFGVANNMEFCCPKCVYRAKKEEAMKDHLEMELTKIRWCCSLCPNNFQTYHQAQFHCKSHTGMAARPKEAIRDPNMRMAWVNAVIQVQKTGMKAATNENTFSPNKSQEPEDSLLVVRYEEKVPMPEQSSRPAPDPTPEPSTSRPETPESDDEKLVIDEIFAPKRIGKVTVCPHCNYQSKHAVVVRDHVYRHYGLYPYACSYCEFSGYRATVSTHLDSVHPHEPKKIKAVPVPKGPPTVANLQKRIRRKTTVNDWRYCTQCQLSVSIDQACAHTHGNQPGLLAKHGDVVVNCELCHMFRKDFDFMNEHFAAEHPGRVMNLVIYQILFNAGSSEPLFKKLPNMPSETIDIDNDDGSPPQKKVARKSTTKLPMQMVAKKSTTKLPLLYISEEEEYSYYGTKPTPIDAFENVTTLMPFNNTLLPFSVKKLSEIIKINPRVVVKDAKKVN